MMKLTQQRWAFDFAETPVIFRGSDEEVSSAQGLYVGFGFSMLRKMCLQAFDRAAIRYRGAKAEVNFPKDCQVAGMQTAGSPQRKRGIAKESFSVSRSSSDQALRIPFKGTFLSLNSIILHFSTLFDFGLVLPSGSAC